MEEGESEPALSRKEMRKQKLMEYLAAKGKLKLPSVRPNLSGVSLSKKPVTSAPKVVAGKENKAPADRFRREISKGPSVTARSGQEPEKKAFGVSNKCNSSKPGGLQSSTRPAQLKPNPNPPLTRTFDVASFKSNVSAASQVTKQAKARIQSSSRAPLNTAQTARGKPNSRVTFDPSSAPSFPMTTVSSRISLGPLVKTKTGLTPAVIQPRASKPKLPHISVTAATTSTQAARKAKSCTTSSISGSQRSARGLPSAVRAVNKAQGQNQLSSQPALGTRSQPSSKSQLSRGLKPKSVSLKSTAASFRPAGRGTANKAAGQPAKSSTKPGLETNGDKNVRPLKAAFQTSSRPTNRCSSRPVGGLMLPAVTDMGKKTKVTKETAGKTENRLSKVPAPKAAGKSRGAALMSQTVPPPARTVSLTGHATDTKTPKVQVRVIPQTEGKNMTAAQVERMKKLQEWREARGISYKRPPMQVKAQMRRTVSVQQPFWASMDEEDEACSLICAVDRSLADCIKLLREGGPKEQVRGVLSRLPLVSQKFAKYWICRARLMELEGNLDVLPMFEEAVSIVLEPVDELRTVVFDILKKKDEFQVNLKQLQLKLEESWVKRIYKASEGKEKESGQIPESSPECGRNPTMTPKPVRALIYGERGGSSVVKYKITATPGGCPSQRRESVKVIGQDVRFFTPVRRSVRIERASLRYPSPLQDHDLCVQSYDDLLCEDEKERSEEQTGDISSPLYVYRENEALKDKVLVQLVYEDTD